MLAGIIGFLIGVFLILFLWITVEKKREDLVYDGKIIIDRVDPDSPPEIYFQFSSQDKLVDGVVLECKVIEKTSQKKHPL